MRVQIMGGHPPNLLLQRSSLNKGGKMYRLLRRFGVIFLPLKGVRGMNYLNLTIK